MGQADTVALWFWGIGQATGIGLATWCLLAMGTRLAPAARARIAVCALWLMGCAPVLMLLPIDGLRLGSTKSSVAAEPVVAPAVAKADPDEEATMVDWNQLLLSAADWLVIAVEGSSDPLVPAPSGPSWVRWALAWIAGCMAYGCLRIMAGVWQIQAIRARARACTDQRLLSIGRQSAAALELKTPVHWLQHSAIGSPAVVGLFRPAIILPEECSHWNDEQLKCAFAHELAHVKRHDVLATLLAQLALVLNYFHPVGHLLIRRMRLDQELAADCLAAPIVGGQRVYLQTLAALALQRPYARTRGPALAFLPTRRTFVRRLEMLRTLHLASTQATHWQAIVLPLCILCLAFTAMLVRPTLAQAPIGGQAPPRSTAPADAQEKEVLRATSGAQPASDQPADEVPELLNYLPDAATVGVLVVDIEKLLQAPPLATLLAQVPPEQRVLNLPFGKLNIDDVESVMLLVTGLDRQSDLLAVRFKSGKPIPQPVKPEELPTKTYGFVLPMTTLDARTVLLGSKPFELKPLLLLASAAGDRGDLRSLIRRHPESSIRGAVRVSELRPVIEPRAAQIGFLGPLWRDVTTASVGLQLGKRLELQATLDSSQPGVVRETLEALKTLGRNALNNPVEPSLQAPNNAAQKLMLLHMAREFGNSALKNLVITEQPGTVQVTTHLEQPTPAVLSLILPAIKTAREAAARTRDINALKQIALAMHNYHDAYGHFPPAIITENGVERSWRVELLPFIEQAAVYNQYRKDEPWDSPHNKRLGMIQIPIYAPSVVSTSAPVDPSLTPFRGVGGERGMLGRVGRKLVDITDGTSNTLMVVQVPEMVPWSKPEEYAPTPEELLKAVQPTGGFSAAFGDGAVRYISSLVDPNVLKALMTIDGGEIPGPVP